METRLCQSCENQFAFEPEDKALLDKFDLPEPKECFRCIWKRLLAFFVFGRFRKTTSALSGKTIITTFSESVKFPLYSRDEWVSDAWDPTDYGLEYDLSRPFFEQFAELQSKVPHPHQSGTKNVRCEWCDDAWNCKDCYLCRSMVDCENVDYGYRTFRCKDSVDVTFCFDAERSYDCLYCFKCFGVRHSFDARDCVDSAFLYDCRNCQNCFMCWNLRNKRYHILNKPYSREEYFEKLKEFNAQSYSGVGELKRKFEKMVAQEAIHRFDYNVKVTNSTGNFLEECKNCFLCYFLQYSENCRYIFRGFRDKDTIYAVASIVERGAYSVMDGYTYETIATSRSTNCRYSAYLDYCEECEYCFGCVGLRKKKYCILNKQYSKEEYNDLVGKIKGKMKNDGEWGNFFPYSMAYGGYNFSMGNQYFPESKEGMEKLGGLWEDPEEKSAEGISGDKLLETIAEVGEEITRQPIICPKTNWRFNIAPREFRFYKAHNIPPPRHHFDYRTLQRLKPLTEIAPIAGKCHFCSKEITHFYGKERNYQKIACMDCYRKEVY